MESGRLQYSGTANELRENPELLHSAYLLSGSEEAKAARAAAAAPRPGPASREP